MIIKGGKRAGQGPLTQMSARRECPPGEEQEWGNPEEQLQSRGSRSNWTGLQPISFKLRLTYRQRNAHSFKVKVNPLHAPCHPHPVQDIAHFLKPRTLSHTLPSSRPALSLISNKSKQWLRFYYHRFIRSACSQTSCDWTRPLCVLLFASLNAAGFWNSSTLFLEGLLFVAE